MEILARSSMKYQRPSSIHTCGQRVRVGASLCLAIGLLCGAASAGAQSTMPVGPQADTGSSMSGARYDPHGRPHVPDVAAANAARVISRKPTLWWRQPNKPWNHIATITRPWPPVIGFSCPMFHKPSITFPGAIMQLRRDGNLIPHVPHHCCIQKRPTAATNSLE